MNPTALAVPATSSTGRRCAGRRPRRTPTRRRRGARHRRTGGRSGRRSPRLMGRRRRAARPRRRRRPWPGTGAWRRPRPGRGRRRRVAPDGVASCGGGTPGRPVRAGRATERRPCPGGPAPGPGGRHRSGRRGAAAPRRPARATLRSPRHRRRSRRHDPLGTDIGWARQHGHAREQWHQRVVPADEGPGMQQHDRVACWPMPSYGTAVRTVVSTPAGLPAWPATCAAGTAGSAGPSRAALRCRCRHGWPSAR